MTGDMAALVLVMASGDMGLGATNCRLLTIKQLAMVTKAA